VRRLQGQENGIAVAESIFDVPIKALRDQKKEVVKCMVWKPIRSVECKETSLSCHLLARRS
jgi:hypothetical protein